MCSARRSSFPSAGHPAPARKQCHGIHGLFENVATNFATSGGIGRPDVHRERCRALDLAGYRLHDARHHWAVRMVRAGMPLELVARQLGHRDVVMVAKVYGRFVPNTVERDRWEKAAAALDKKKWKDLGTSQGTSASRAHGRSDAQRPATDSGHGSWENSRGGTRARDPGIMSSLPPGGEKSAQSETGE